MQTVQKEAGNRARKIQLNFTQFMITNKRKQPAKYKRKGKQKTQRGELAHSDTKKTTNAEPSKKKQPQEKG